MRMEGWIDRHDKANSYCSQFCEYTYKKGSNVMLYMEIYKCGNTVGKNSTHPILTVRQKRIGVATNRCS